MAVRPKRQHNAAATVKVIQWMLANRAKLEVMSFRAAIARCDSECKVSIAPQTFKAAAAELGIAFRGSRSRRSSSSKDRLWLFIKTIQILVKDIERLTGMEPGSIGRENGSAHALSMFVGKKSYDEIRDHLASHGNMPLPPDNTFGIPVKE